MTLHEFKDGVWYQEPGCAVQYMRDGDNWYLREDATGNPIATSSFSQRVALCTTFREVATDPVDEAWKEHNELGDAPPAERRGFLAGWSARERVGFQIDVEAAKGFMTGHEDGCVGPWSMIAARLVHLFNRINSGEFRLTRADHDVR